MKLDGGRPPPTGATVSILERMYPNDLRMHPCREGDGARVIILRVRVTLKGAQVSVRSIKSFAERFVDVVSMKRAIGPEP